MHNQPVVNPAESNLYTGVPEATAAERTAELTRAKRLAERYRLEFVDLSQYAVDHELFRSIPADLMLRYGFVPYHREGQALVIVVSDPTDLPMIDELAVLLATPITVDLKYRDRRIRAHDQRVRARRAAAAA